MNKLLVLAGLLLCVGSVFSAYYAVTMYGEWQAVDTSAVNSVSEKRCEAGETHYFSSVSGEILDECAGNAIAHTISDENILRLVVHSVSEQSVCKLYGVLGGSGKLLSAGNFDFNNLTAGQHLCISWHYIAPGLCAINFDLNLA